MGIQILTFSNKEPWEAITYGIDYSSYGSYTLVSASSTVYLANDRAQTDIPGMRLMTPTISGPIIYQTITSGSSGNEYVLRIRTNVSGSYDQFEEQGKFSVIEI